MANDDADPDSVVDEVELEMKQCARLLDSFSRLGWYDDREAVIAFCEAREKAQGV